MADWVNRTFAEAMDWAARTHGGRTAVVHNDRRLTYGALADRARNLAKGLLGLGLRPGDKVGLWAADSIDWMVARWAVPAMGCVLVPINTRFLGSELSYVLKQADIRALIMGEGFRGTSFSNVLAGIVPDLAAQKPGRWAVEAFPELRLVVGIGAGHGPGVVPFEEIEQRGAAESGLDILLADARRSVAARDVAQIMYTSGTTSFPKGAMIGHGAVLQNNFNTLARQKLTAEDCYLATIPLFSATGTAYTLSSFFAGGRVVLMDRFSPERFCDLVEEEKVTGSFFLDPIVQDLQAYPRIGQRNLRSLRLGVGAPLGERLFRWLAVDCGIGGLAGAYGLSETSNAATRGAPDEPLETRVTTCGRPLPGIEMRIAHIETGAPQAVGEAGEIQVRGYTLMQGYYKKPEETAASFTADGWLKTGDLGALTESGHLLFKGRIKEMMKSGGFNVSTLEVEEFMKGIPQIKQVTVVGVPDPRFGEAGYAFVETREGASIAPEAIIGHCKAHMAGYKVPRYVEFVSEWPLTSTGKIKKLWLKEQAARRVQQGNLRKAD
ncbi:MAG: class I adenylate-forming enzyme family protein [Reyranellaceae bacterium]